MRVAPFLVVLGLFLAACAGAAPPPVAPKTAADPVEIVEDTDFHSPLVTGALEPAQPLHAGQPGVVHLTFDAPKDPGGQLQRGYQGFTADFPMKLDVEVTNTDVANPTIEAKQGVDQDADWKPMHVDFHVHLTPKQAGTIWFSGKLEYSLCSKEICTTDRVRIHGHVDVLP